MRLKTRLNRRIKINKSKDEKVPIAWEQGKEISKLGFRECKAIQDTELDRKLKTVIHYKISEQQDDFWWSEEVIEEIVFEHATIHNVEFEWGTFGRAYRFKADVRGKDLKLGKVHKAEVGVLYDISEETQPLTVWNNSHLCQASVILSDRHIVRKETRQVKECPQEKEFSPETQIIMKDDISNIIYKNTKYFCKKCDIYICNACFSNDCMNHDVQWIGNATFACESIYHKFNVTK